MTDSSHRATSNRYAGRAVADYQALLTAVPDAMLMLDGDGRILLVNDQTEKLFGYKRKELLGEPVEILVPESLRETHRGHRKGYNLTSSSRSMGTVTDIVARRKDGSEFPVDISLGLCEMETGALTIATIVDITERKRVEEAQRVSQEWYRDYYEYAPTAYMSIDPETGVMIECNEATADLLGRSKDEIIGHQAFEFYAPESRERARAAIMEFRQSGQLRGVELQLQRRDGTLIDVSLDATAVRDEAGRIVRTRSIWRDITERRRFAETLADIALFAEMNPAPVLRLDQHGTILRVNEAARMLFRDQPLLGNSWLALCPDLGEEPLACLLEAKDTPQQELQIGERWYLFTFRANEDHEQVFVYGADITDRKQAEEALREQVRRDPLTGVLNHAAIVEELQTMIALGRARARCAVAMVDIDAFKATNDTYGHQAGDEVLMAVVSTLSQHGAIVGRYGGDEFLAILPGDGRTAAERYRANVIDKLASAGLTDTATGASVPIAVSIGLAIYPEEAETVAGLIRLSDSAMYASRRQRPVGSKTLGPSETKAA